MTPTPNEERELNHGLVCYGVGTFGDPSAVVEYAEAAEAAGWDGIFLFDHLIWPFVEDPDEYDPTVDPWITLSGVAARTEELTLGTWITPVPRRQPWQLAKNLATLDHLSDGRVMLGAGLGTGPDYTRFGREYDQRRLGERYDEALEVIAGLWADEPFSYDGEFFDLDEAVLKPTPVQEPRIPIVIGGWWPHRKPFRRAARWDGVAPNWPSMLQHLDSVTVEELPEHIQDAIAQQRSHEAELSDLLSYYREHADEPGEVVLRAELPSTPPDFIDTCRELGATWLLTSPLEEDATRAENLERIRDGPPD